MPMSCAGLGVHALAPACRSPALAAGNTAALGRAGIAQAGQAPLTAQSRVAGQSSQQPGAACNAGDCRQSRTSISRATKRRMG